jgi:hypothetical protein
MKRYNVTVHFTDKEWQFFSCAQGIVDGDRYLVVVDAEGTVYNFAQKYVEKFHHTEFEF